MLFPQYANMKRCSKCGVDKPTDDGRAWNHDECPDCVAERQRQYRQTHREEIAEYRQSPHGKAVKAKLDARRYANLKALDDGTVDGCTVALLRYVTYDNRCAYCFDLLTDDAFELDHIIPVSKGGWTSIYNLAPCCRLCNRGVNGKFNKDLLEWLDITGIIGV